jgi:hypothetical protein
MSPASTQIQRGVREPQCEPLGRERELARDGSCQIHSLSRRAVFRPEHGVFSPMSNGETIGIHGENRNLASSYRHETSPLVCRDQVISRSIHTHRVQNSSEVRQSEAA